MTKKLVPLLSLLITFCLVFSALSAEDAQAPMKKVQKLPFGKWYKPVEYKVTPAIKGYNLPLSTNQLEQFKGELASFNMTPFDVNLLSNGFTISDEYTNPSVADFYGHFRDKKLPIYITTDSILHLYHILFDKILADAEEKNFVLYLQEMFAHSISEMEKLRASAKTEEAIGAIKLAEDYSIVALALLSGGKGNSPETNAELALIAAHSGFASSPLFTYEEDYSQYVPRGHYTRSETLKKYFRSMMWLGRMTFLAKGKENKDDDALISIAEAKKQTLAAAIIADTLRKYPKKAQYETIYDFTSFFVGYSDDLTPNEYNNALSEVIGTDGNLFSITKDETFRKLQLNILKFAPPAIYSGTGNIQIDNIESNLGKGMPELLQKALESTIGMRYMGQRFVIDSYFTGKLVYPTIGKFLGSGSPFTGSPKRTMPTALDIMNLLGSNSAKNLLIKGQMTQYEKYLSTVKKLEAELNLLSQADWNKNLYMGWLNSIRALFAKAPDGYQPFQRTNMWENRQLLSALGSWTALRHDTILYVKQSYAQRCMGLPPKKPKTLAYVEGEPEFWARLLALHQTMQKGVSTYKLTLSSDVNGRMTNFEYILKALLDVSILQLEQNPIPQKLSHFLENIADFMRGIQGKTFKEFTTQIVADVHTDANSKTVLEEGTGNMMTIIVAYSNPDGSISLAYGPVYSYYEFKQPMSSRLTDENWRKMLSKTPPKMPTWIKEMLSAPVGTPTEKDRF